MSLTQARAKLSDVVESARLERSPVYLTRRGRRVAAVVDSDALDELITAAEDLADLKAAAEARAELDAGAESIPWEEVKADFGLL